MSVKVTQWRWLVLAALAVPAGLVVGSARGAVTLTNVYVANVTPSEFSVFMQTDVPSEHRIELYADPGGVTRLDGVLGVESCAVDQGDASLSNAVASRASRRAICSDMAAKGLSLSRVSSCAPDTTYYFRLLAATGGTVVATWPPGGALRAVTTMRQNAFVVDAKQLLVSVPGQAARGCVGVLEYAGGAHPLASVAGDRAAEDEIHFDLSQLFGPGGTNLLLNGDTELTITVYGVDPLPRAQRDYQVHLDTNLVVAGTSALIADAAYLYVGIGSTSILSDVAWADVPIEAVSAPESTNLSFELTIPSSVVTGLVVTPVIANIGEARLVSVGADRWRLVFESAAGQVIHDTSAAPRTIARLRFTPTAGVLTTVVQLDPQSLQSVAATNRVVAGGATSAGELQIIGRQPFLQWSGSGGFEAIDVSGIPGTEYVVEISTNLRAGAWAELSRFTLGPDELETVVPLPGTNAPAYFLRILEAP